MCLECFSLLDGEHSICKCGKVAIQTTNTKNVFVVYTDDLKNVTVKKVWLKDKGAIAKSKMLPSVIYGKMEFNNLIKDIHLKNKTKTLLDYFKGDKNVRQQ
jgi:hypothetical protein